MNVAELRRPAEDIEAAGDRQNRRTKPLIDAAHPVRDLRGPRSEQHRPKPATPPDALSTEESLNLIDKASTNFVSLVNRSRQLEDHVRQLDAWSSAQIQAAEAAAANWEIAASDTNAKLQELQQENASLRLRLESAEHDLLRDRRALHAIQERIVNAFGFGSEAHESM